MAALELHALRELRVHRGADRVLLVGTVETQYVQPSQLLDLGHEGDRGSGKMQIEQPQRGGLELNTRGCADQREQPYLAAPVVGQPDGRRGQDVCAPGIAGEDNPRLAPDGEIVGENPLHVRSGLLRGPPSPEVLEAVEAHHRQAVLVEHRAHVPHQTGPAPVP